MRRLLRSSPQDACVLAGGTWLVPDLNRGDVTPGSVIDLAHAGLRDISRTRDTLRIGAMCTYTDLLRSETIANDCRLLGLMANEITGGAQIRNRGTLGGSLAAARVGFDAPTALVALNAEIVVMAPRDVRRTTATDFLVGERRTCLEPNEFISGFEIPVAAREAHGYCKVKRSESSWPITTAAAVISTESSHTPLRARIAIGGLNPVPILLELESVELHAASLLDLFRTKLADRPSLPFSDVLAPASYRAAVAPVAASRALTQALDNLLTQQTAV